MISELHRPPHFILTIANIRWIRKELTLRWRGRNLFRADIGTILR